MQLFKLLKFLVNVRATVSACDTSTNDVMLYVIHGLQFNIRFFSIGGL